MGFYCCRLTSRMDWLPSGLILKDPVWITFLGSIWEMAHSISSTRALQAAGGGREDTHIRIFLLICAAQICTHTSTSHVLRLSGRLAETKEVEQNHARREQQSTFPHLAPTDLTTSQCDTSTGKARKRTSEPP